MNFFWRTELSSRCEFGQNFGTWRKLTFSAFSRYQNFVQTRSDGWVKWHWVKGLVKIKFKNGNQYCIALLSRLRLYCIYSRFRFLKCNVVRPLSPCHFSQPSDRVWTNFWYLEKAENVSFLQVPKFCLNSQREESSVRSKKVQFFLPQLVRSRK